MARLPKDVMKLPLLVRAQLAMKAAVKKAIADHLRAGTPVYVWQKGRVVDISRSLRAKAAAKSRRRLMIHVVHPKRRRK